MGPWSGVAAVLVVALAVLFAVLFIRQQRRIRYVLRNRLTPLTVLTDEPAPIERWLPWGVVGLVVVVGLSVLALA